MIKNVRISLSKLTRIQQAIQKNCIDKNAESANKEEVMAKVIKAFIVWEFAEHNVFGSTDDALEMMSDVIEKMRSGEIIVDVVVSKKQLDKIREYEESV